MFPFSIALNPAYVADALAHVSGTVEMRMNGELDPVVFASPDSDAIHLVMPMRNARYTQPRRTARGSASAPPTRST